MPKAKLSVRMPHFSGRPGMGKGHEAGQTTMGCYAPAGVHSLTDELLASIIKVLYDSTPHEPEKGPAGSSLLPLRTVSRAFRKAVDTNIRASGIRVISRNARSGALLVRVQDAIQHRLPHWPDLRELRFLFDWKPDYLHVALSSIARACPRLHTLKLEHQLGTMAAAERDNDDEPCLAPLSALPSLRKLILVGFGFFTHWSDGLSLLSHLTMLELHSPGDVTLSPPPSLEQLDIQGLPDGTKPVLGLENLTQSTRLRDIALSHVTIQALPLSLPLTALQKLSLVEVLVLPPAYGGAQQHLLHQLLSSDPSLLPGLTDLTLEDVCSGLPEDLSLSACTALTALSLVLLPNVRTLRLGNARKLWKLQINNVPQLQELPGFNLDCLPGLQLVLLSNLPRLEQLPPLATFLQLNWLGLCDLPLVTNLPDLGRLTSLTMLGVDRCPRLEIEQASISTLHKLETCHLVGPSPLQGNHPLLGLPEPADVPNLKTVSIGSFVEPPASFNEIGSLRGLQDLMLMNISGISKLPSGISQLQHLTSLFVTGCSQLRGLQLDGLHSLKFLELRGFRLETALPHLGHLTALTELEVHDFPMLDALPSLKGLRALRSLGLSDCPEVKEVDLRAGRWFHTVIITDCASIEKVKVGPTVAVKFSGLPKLQCLEH